VGGYDVGMAVETRRRLFTVDEYFTMAEAGIFADGPRVELLDGEIVEMSPQGDAHVHVSARTNHALVRAYDGAGYEVRPASTFRAGARSAPEPDFGVVPELTGRVLEVSESVLLVEVSDSSLSTDRRTKRSIYARMGAPCYWIVEIPARQVRVLTEPRDGDYRTETLVGEDGVLRLPVVGKEIPVAELLPAT
jgi:Uma2 family endonuclease